MRLRQNFTKAETTSVIQDIQKYKQIKNNPEKLGDDEVQRLLDSEFGAEWGNHLSGVYEVLTFLQAEDEQSKFLFNSVKNVTKTMQVSKQSEELANKLKISNGFKNLVSKVIRQTLTVLAYKVEVYLAGNVNHQIKLSDIKKIVKIWITFDDVDDLKQQFAQFEASVDQRIADIQSAKSEKKLSDTSSKSQ